MPGFSTPFAQLDTLYRQIFSTVQDLDLVFSILAYSILRKRSTISFIAHFYNIPEIDVRLALVDLSSVINCEKGTIRFLHASLPDFLLDKTRSQEFHLCLRTWSTRLAISWLNNVSVGIFSGICVNSRSTKWIYTHRNLWPGTDSLFDFLVQAECTPALREKLILFHPVQLSYMGRTTFFSEYLSIIQKLVREFLLVRLSVLILMTGFLWQRRMLSSPVGRRYTIYESYLSHTDSWASKRARPLGIDVRQWPRGTIEMNSLSTRQARIPTTSRSTCQLNMRC